MDDATVENGCLWALPGSHRRGVTYPDRETDHARFDCTVESCTARCPTPGATACAGRWFHYMSAESRLPWFPPADGDWMAHADHRDVVLVAGEDPYAYLGTTDVWRPHVRPEREGGCAR